MSKLENVTNLLACKFNFILMKEPKVKDVVAWIIAICEGQEDEKLIAAQNLESLPIGYFEEHSIPKTKIKHCVNSLPNILLGTQSPGLKEWCVQLIGELRILSENSIKALHYALHDNSDKIIIPAIWALRELRTQDSETERLLIQKANHPNKDVRWRIAWALSTIGYNLEETKNALINMLKDDYELCRGYALIALDKNQNLNQAILDKILKMTNDPEEFPSGTAKNICKKYHLK